MSWTPLVAPKGPAAARGPHKCTASTSAGNFRRTPKLSLVLRPGLMGGADWLVVDQMVDVQVGFADHAGRLRIEPGSAYRLSRLARGRPDGAPVVLRLPMPPGIVSAQRAVAVCEVGLVHRALEVTLPAWGRPPVVPRGTQLAAEAAAAARQRAGL